MATLPIRRPWTGGGVGWAVHLVTHFAFWYIALWRYPKLQFVIPYLHEIFTALLERHWLTGVRYFWFILQNVWITLQEALTGFVVGNLLGMALAVVMLFVPFLRGVVLRDAILVKNIPWIMFIPILKLLMGSTFQMRVSLIVLSCFFTTLIMFHTGLHEVDDDVMDYSRTLPGMTRWKLFWHVRLFYSLPFLFGALKSGAAIVVVAAIVVEWLTAQEGLGSLLYTFQMAFRMDLLMSLALFATALSVTLMKVVSVIESIVIPDSIRKGADSVRI